MKTKCRKLLPYCLAFFVPIIIFLCAFYLLPSFGITRSILYQDPNVEFVDFLAYFKHLFTGEDNFFYSFNMGGGTGMIALIAFYLFSPFNLIAILFPNHLLGYAFFIIVLLEIGAAGLTCYYYFRKEHSKLGPYKPLIFSLGYALSAYTLGYFEHFEWLDSIVILPLVCLGINKIIKEKSPWLYLITLSIAIITCYYSGFMICIFSVLWLIYKLIIKKDSTNNSKIIKKFTLASIFAGAISAFLILPTFFAMFTGNVNRLDSSALTLGSKFPISQLFLQITSNQSYYAPLIYGGLVVTILAIFYFTNNKINTKNKLASLAMLFILTISMNITIFCAIWHLGSIERGAPYRFTFIVTFFILTLAATTLEEYRSINRKNSILAVIIFIIVYMLKLPEQISPENNILFYLDLIIAFVITFIILKSATTALKNSTIIALQAISLFGFTLIMLITLGKWELGVSKFSTTQTILQETSEIVDKVKQIETPYDNFYRVEKTFKRSENDGLQQGYHGTSQYTSTSVPTVQKTLIGNSSFAVNATYDTTNNGQISIGDLPPLSSISLTNVKYVITPKDANLSPFYFKKITNTDQYDAYEYLFPLPLGFIINQDSATINNKKATELINNLATSELGKNKEVFSEFDHANIHQELQNVVKLKQSYSKIVSTSDGFINYQIDNPTQSTVFYSFDFSYPDGSHVTALSEVLKRNPSTGEFEHLSHLSRDRTLNLGNDKHIEIMIKFSPDELSLYNEHFYLENEAISQELITTLSQQFSHWNQTSNNALEGHVKVDRDDQELVLSLEYDKSWQIEVDGNPIEPERAFGNLLGLKLNRGEHSITMRYVPIGWKAGVFISLFGIISSIAWYIINRKKQND